MRSRHPGRYYVKAQHLRRTIRRAYDQVLSEYDLLLMPTTPMAATPLPGPDAGAAERSRRASEMLANTGPFDVSGHPALSLPCGATADGRPVGMMFGGAALRRDHAFIGQRMRSSGRTRYELRKPAPIFDMIDNH